MYLLYLIILLFIKVLITKSEKVKMLKFKILFIPLIFAFSITKAQQIVTFNLDKSSFETKPSYLEPLTIEGKPVKNGADIDVIWLTVKSISQDDRKNLDKYDKEIKELKDKLSGDTSEVNFLNSLKTYNTDEIEKIYTFYKGIKPKIIYEISESILEKEESAREGLITNLKTEVNKKIKELGLDILDYKNEINNLEVKKSALSDSVFKKVKVTNPLWVRSNKYSNFQFSIEDRLQMEEHYSFTFELFTKQKTEFPIEPVFEKLDIKLDSVLDNQGAIDKTQITEFYRDIMKKANNDFFASKYEYDSIKNNLVKHTSAISTLMKDSLIIGYISLYKAKENYNNNKKSITDLYTSLQKIIDTTFIWKTMSERYKTLLSNQFKSGEIDTVYFATFVDKFKENKNIYSLLKSKPKDATLLFKSLLKNILVIDLNKTRISSEIKKLKDSYVIEDIVSSSLASSSIETDIDGVKVSTSYGIAAIPLGFNFNTFTPTELSYYVALHYRLGAFDNRLSGKKAYKSLSSHFSIMTGIATTPNLKYKGVDLQNTRLGIKPMLGISYEPLKRFNISVGIIAFLLNQPGIQSEYSETKFKPFVSIAFDFDVINSLIHKTK